VSRRAIRRLCWTARAGVSAAVLAGLVIGTIGFPAAPNGTLGAAYPCQGNGCGCRSAADCWFGCCCLTPAQRLAWAERNGVTPPPQLVQLARSEPRRAAKVASCCAGHADRACCRTTKPCCSETPERHVAKRSNHSAPEIAPGRCRGASRWWVAAGQPLALPERPITLTEATGSEPLLMSCSAYSLDADSPPTRPG
jgi:hypothetical protein